MATRDPKIEIAEIKQRLAVIEERLGIFHSPKPDEIEPPQDPRVGQIQEW